MSRKISENIKMAKKRGDPLFFVSEI